MSRYSDAFNRMKISLDEICEKYNKRKIWFYWDALKAFVIYGVTPNQYIGFEFYKKSRLEKMRYYTARKSDKIEKTFNDPSKAQYFNDKVLFNQTFTQWVKRDYIATENATDEDLQRFVNKHKKVIVKPISLSSGRGIHVYRGGCTLNALKNDIYIGKEYRAA